MKKTIFFLSIALCIFLGLTTAHYKKKAKHSPQVYIPVVAEVLLEKLAKPIPTWMTEQIQKDLAPYAKTGITQQMLDDLFQGKRINELNLIRFQIRDGQIAFSLSEKNLESRQFRHILGAFKRLNEIVSLPNVDFVISLEDGFTDDLNVALFVYAKSEKARSLILMPDFKALTGYPRLREHMEKGSKRYPWEKKIAKAFWRGASTGAWLTAANWDKIARTKLAILSLSHPKEIDAKINGIVQCNQDIADLIKAKGIVGNTVSQIDHLKYKYLIDVDGNSCSFERYFWGLLSNSVILKQVTPNIQWYYGGLKPYEHFVPVNEDLSDLLTQLEWVRTHEQESKEIGERATEFVKNNLSPEDIFLYMVQLLKAYANLQVKESSQSK